MDEFFSALKKNIDSELIKIKDQADSEIATIREKNRQKIVQLREEELSLEKKKVLLESFHKNLSDKQLEWMERINHEKGKFLDQLMVELQNRFSSISQESIDFYVKLYNEVKDNIGNDFRVHISKTANPDKFKTKAGLNYEVIADLDRNGIIIQRNDIPLSIENTLESRLEKIRDDLRIQASHMMWEDIENSPWKVKDILNRLLDSSN